MSSHRVHEAFGIITWVFLLAFLLLVYSLGSKRLIFVALIGFCLCFLGSVLPDIDNKRSRIFKHAKLLVGVVSFVVSFGLLTSWIDHKTLTSAIFLLTLCGWISIGAVLLLYALIPKHRTKTHTVKAGGAYGAMGLIVSYVLLYDLVLSAIVAFFSFLSYASHLAIDRGGK